MKRESASSSIRNPEEPFEVALSGNAENDDGQAAPYPVSRQDDRLRDAIPANGVSVAYGGDGDCRDLCYLQQTT